MRPSVWYVTCASCLPGLSLWIFHTSVGLVINPACPADSDTLTMSSREITVAPPLSLCRTMFCASDDSSTPLSLRGFPSGCGLRPTEIRLPRYFSSSLVALTTSYS